ncbi:MAG: NAD+ synthase [DPANN group archaeon]|nr:NAD+ synthase [DPANN group archaeon]
MKIALAQINSTVGDLEGNVKLHLDTLKEAKGRGADLVVFPEMGLTGYPPKDLLYNEKFLIDVQQALNDIIGNSQGIHAIVGFIDSGDNLLGPDGRSLKFNAAALVGNDKYLGFAHKTLLPTYDVFDEARYFNQAKGRKGFTLGDNNIGIEICEDLWDKHYPYSVTKDLVDQGADFIINISASPFHYGKLGERLSLLSKQASRYRVPIAYCNMVGAQDDMIFDGRSMVVDTKGNLKVLGKSFEEDLVMFDTDSIETMEKLKPSEPSDIAEIHDALVLGIRDYYRKAGVFNGAIIGLSGGIDSAVTAALAVEALGKDKVRGVYLPSKYSSDESHMDALYLAKNLEIPFDVEKINGAVDALNEMVTSTIGFPYEKGVTAENIQARLRGNYLMALSNDGDLLLLATGNKSELAVGYCTLYGDMTGGFAPLSDVFKTQVNGLAKYINRDEEIIPNNTITRPPSAELKPDQRDEDELLPYETLDPILKKLIEEDLSPRKIAQDLDIAEDVIFDILWKVNKAEYKRYQMPLGLKITPRSWTGRDMPIVNKYKG